ncbi:MAG: sporulation integral membrane protein YtvI [Clostridia bacterium]|nr:sporulation integral membrane protein YtvI [Clostridia bacterium]
MSTNVEKRRAVLINVAYFILLIGAFYLFMRFAFWTVAPFMFAFFIAMLLQKPVHAVTTRTPLKKGFVSFISVMFIATLFLGLIALAGTTIFSELKGFAETLRTSFKSIPDFINAAEAWVLRVLSHLPEAIETTLSTSVSELFDSLSQSFTENSAHTADSTASGLSLDFSSIIAPLSGVISTASKVPSFLISIVIFFIACCFMTADYDRIVGFIKRQLPASKRDALTKTKNLTLSTLGKMAKAYLIIICITFTELLIGMTVLDLLGLHSGNYKFLIAFGIALIDIFPILGSGTILIPWGFISLFTNRVGLGIGLFVIYAIITVLRQYIEPKLVAGQLGLPPIVTLICMYLGIKIFGVLGIFILPLTITIIKVLNDDGVIHLWKTSRQITEEGTSSVELKLPKLKLKKNTKGRNKK